MKEPSLLKLKERFVVPKELTNDIDTRSFNALLSPSSPLEKYIQPRRCEFARWLREEPLLGGKGLYIWLLPRKGGLRFLHVGISAKGQSTLATRTKHHCRFAFHTDPLHEYDKDQGEFGLLKKRRGPYKRPDSTAVVSFLTDIRILYLCPDKADDTSLIRPLEGALAHGARLAYGGDGQITNTLSKVTGHDDSICTLACQELNRVLPILPP